MSLVLIILLLFIVFGGGGGAYNAHTRYGGPGFGGVVVVLGILWTVGH